MEEAKDRERDEKKTEEEASLAMDAPLRLLLPPPSSSSSEHHHRMLTTTTTATPSGLSLSSCCVCLARKRPWDSNAESFRRRKFDFRYGDDDDREEEDEDDTDDENWIDQGSGFVQKAVDNIFIFKVLKSYGWMLPFIIISMLLVSGPKAFVYTLGLAIALSLIAYAFQNLTQSTPARKFKLKKRSSTVSNRRNAYVEPDKASRKRRKESTVTRTTRTDDSVGNSVQVKPFGGWDELDEAIDYKAAAPMKTPDKVNAKESVESTATEPLKVPNQTRVRSELNRLNRRRREMSKTPLLLRLLVAAFPFLSSWIKLL